MQISVLNHKVSHNLAIYNFDLQRHTDIYTLVHEFNNAAMDFQTACTCTENTTVLIDKAVTAVSRYNNILLKKRDFFTTVNMRVYRNSYLQEDELSNSEKIAIQIIIAGVNVLEALIEEAKKFDPNMLICSGLYKNIYDFYKSEIGYQLNSSFWYDLKLYEFLICNEVIENKHYSCFVLPEELENFFLENKKSVLSDLLDAENIDNPLSSQRLYNFFLIFKLISSISSKYQITKLIE